MRKYFLNEPGFVFNKNISFYRDKVTYSRIVFFFEKILENLYLETSKLVGIDINSKLWFDIGKDFGLRCLSFSQLRNVPNSDIKKILDLIFEFMKDFGFKKIKLKGSLSRKHLFLEIRDSPSNEFENLSFFSGLICGVFSYVYGFNFKVKCIFSLENFKKFKLIKTQTFLEIPQYIFLDEKYYFYNVPNRKVRGESLKHSSMLDFLKFKKIFLKEDLNLWKFQNHNIIPCEVGLFGLIFYHYHKLELDVLLKEKITIYSESIFMELFEGIHSEAKRIRLFINILSAFGWGILHLESKNNFLKLKFFSPPFSGYDLEFRVFFFNGALNSLYEKSFIPVSYTNFEFIYEFNEVNCGTTMAKTL